MKYIIEGVKTIADEPVNISFTVTKQEPSRTNAIFFDERHVAFSDGEVTMENGAPLKVGAVIKEIILPATYDGFEVRYVPTYTGNIFNNSIKVQKLSFPNVRYIPQEAFSFMEVEQVLWPESCHEISQECFRQSKIGQFVFEDSETLTKILPNAFFEADIEEFEWPENCTEIPSACFYGSTLKKLTGGHNVTTIWHSAFEESRLTDVPDFQRLEMIGAGAFKDTAISSFSCSFPLKTSLLRNGCFMNCPNLKTVSIAADELIIKGYVFSNTPKLRKVTIDAATLSVENISFISNSSKDQNITAEVDISSVETLIIPSQNNENIINFLNPSFNCEIIAK